MNTLSFMEVDTADPTRVVRAWNPSRSDDYNKDCTAGRKMFNDTLECMKRDRNVYLLSRIIEAQVDGGVFGGVEIGFHAALTDRLLRS